jgi:hypothetical protein
MSDQRRAWVPDRAPDARPGELPRISDRAVRVSQERGEAYYKHAKGTPAHPDAAYDIPDDRDPGGRISVILLGITMLIVVVGALVATGICQLPL